MSDNPQVAVAGFAQAPTVAATDGTTNGVEMLIPVFRELLDTAGIVKGDVGFWCSGSSDYLAGRAFSFISAVDAIGAYPPINESHVEADAAWALYEAWVKLRTGEVDVAVVYGFGKSSAGLLNRVLALQTDPYMVAPLWPDAVSLAALQARTGIEAGLWTEKEMAQVAARSLRDARSNPKAQLSADTGDHGDEGAAGDLLGRPYVADPLREHDCAPVGDGAAAILLASGDRARDLVERPAWITGITHRVETPVLGARELTTSSSVLACMRELGPVDAVEVAEIHAPFTHQELLLTRALGLPDGVRINPSGGALTGNPMFSAGLVRIGEAARRIHDGSASSVLAHATQGPVLQHNLVCLMESR